MLAPGHQLVNETEVAYRRAQLRGAGNEATHHPAVRVARGESLLARLRARARRRATDPVRGASRRELDGPLLRPGGWSATPAPRPVGAPHHMSAGC